MLAAHEALAVMDPAALRALTGELLATLAAKDAELERRAAELTTRKAQIDKLTLEIALLRRMRFGRRAEELPAGIQPSLLAEESDADLEEIAAELKALAPRRVAPTPKGQPKRQALPPELPRVDIRHEPESATCACGCRMTLVREEATEKLDYAPGTFTVERHVRPILACPKCETLAQAAMPAYVIDKGLAAPGLLAHVLVAKYADHLPLNRQEAIFARAGVALPRSTLAEWVGACGFALQPVVAALKEEILGHRVLHADETPVRLLTPGAKGVQRAWLWAYTARQVRSSAGRGL
jgi:transposase